MTKNHFGFIDSEKNPHRVDWIADVLFKLFRLQKLRCGNQEMIKLHGDVKQSMLSYNHVKEKI